MWSYELACHNHGAVLPDVRRSPRTTSNNAYSEISNVVPCRGCREAKVSGTFAVCGMFCFLQWQWGDPAASTTHALFSPPPKGARAQLALGTHIISPSAGITSRTETLGRHHRVNSYTKGGCLPPLGSAFPRGDRRSACTHTTHREQRSTPGRILCRHFLSIGFAMARWEFELLS